MRATPSGRARRRRQMYLTTFGAYPRLHARGLLPQTALLTGQKSSSYISLYQTSFHYSK
jgi:hypothetical protein